MSTPASTGTAAPAVSRQKQRGAAAREQTRRRLVTAAGELFAEQGYVGATVVAIAERAGVSLQTLYLAWGSKRELLRAYVETALAGGPHQISTGAWRRQAAHEVTAGAGNPADPVDVLVSFARAFRHVAERAALGWRLYEDAAAVDPQVAADHRDLERQRRRTLSGVLGQLPSTSLRPGLNRRSAVDTMMVVAGPQSYRLLVEDAGYGLVRYERWVASTLCSCLLDPELLTPGR